MLISLIDQFRIFNGWMDGQPGGPRRGSRIFCQGGPGPTARIQDLHMGPIHTYVCIHTYACTDRHMNVLAQADGWTNMYMYRRQTKDRLFITCIIMYRDNVRNIHVRACLGIHARVIILNFPMKMNDLVPSKPTYFIFIGYLKGHGGGGPWKHPKPPQTTSKPPQTTCKPHQTTFLTPSICFCESMKT